MSIISTIRPGYLVGLKTSVVGNVSYSKRDIEAEHITENGEQKASWQTERTIADAAEHKAATKARSRANSIVRSVCSKSIFGLLCPESRKDMLLDAIADARAVADRFNVDATLSRVNVNIIVGKVAADDVEAVKAIGSEMRMLIGAMETGLRNLDPTAVRDAANRARNVGQMLPADAQARVAQAIALARSQAREIVKAGETAAVELDEVAMKRITEARLAFLDLDEAVAPAAPVETGRSLDLTPSLPVETAQAGFAQLELE